MINSQEQLFQLIDKMSEVSVLVIGDLILDRYIWGGVSRISQEAPVPVVEVSKTEDRLGGAGNVVNNLIQLNCSVNVCGLVGEDDEGQLILDMFGKNKVSYEGVSRIKNRPTSLKTRVIARTQQVVRVDREETSDHIEAVRKEFAATIDRQIENADAIIVSDYAKGAVSKEVWDVLNKAVRAGRLGKNKPLVLDPHPNNQQLYQNITIAKPNRKEAEQASGIKIKDRASAREAALVLMAKWNAENMMITLGSDGLLLMTSPQDPGLFLDTIAREVFDVSGAGDAVTAVYTAALAAGASQAMAGDLANIAAGVVVSEVGTAPIRLEPLKQEIRRLSRMA